MSPTRCTLGSGMFGMLEHPDRRDPFEGVDFSTDYDAPQGDILAAILAHARRLRAQTPGAISGAGR